MRVLQVSTADQTGGAHKIPWQMFRGYRARGVDSLLAVGRKESEDSDVLKLPNACDRPWWRWPAFIGRTLLGHEDFDFPSSARLLALSPRRPDLLHLHNLHGRYFDLRAIAELSHRVPVVMTLHDSWLLSGHCAYSFSCERWRQGCGHCPDLKIYPAILRDATAFNWERKRRIYAQSRLHVATPSEWLMARVKDSMLAPGIVESRVIPNGVDLSIFCPANKAAARTALGLPQDRRILLFAANRFRRNRSKDFETLRAAVRRLAERPGSAPLLFLGLGQSAAIERIGNAEIRCLPYEPNERIVAQYQQAADVYVHAAHSEVWGLSITEALACGTPVVATATGGIPEQIRGLGGAFDRGAATGILVPERDPESLAMAVGQLLGDEPLRRQLGQNAADDSRRRFDLNRQIDTHLEWYREILTNSVSRAASRETLPAAP